MPTLALVTLVVPSYAAGIEAFVHRMGFTLIEDTDQGGGKRWVVVAPDTNSGARLLLAQAASPAQQAAIGQQAGGRVGFFLETDDFASAHRRLTEAGIHFLEAPRREVYGTVAQFEDPFGNRWDLLQRTARPDHTATQH